MRQLDRAVVWFLLDLSFVRPSLSCFASFRMPIFIRAVGPPATLKSQYRMLKIKPTGHGLKVRRSHIHGWGLFALEEFPKGNTSLSCLSCLVYLLALSAASEPVSAEMEQMLFATWSESTDAVMHQ